MADLNTEELQDAMRAFRALHFSGINVTLPHKLAVIPYLDSVDQVVQRLGAVNTIKFGYETRGYNTDWVGIYIPVKKIVASTDTVTVFGSGGAARAAIYAAKELGAQKVYVMYRNEKDNVKTEDLINNQKQLGITTLEYDNVSRVVKESDLVVNATSAGMIGHEQLPFSLDLLNGLDMSKKIYLDAVFNPLETPLLKFFKKTDAQTIDGLWMMIFQGVAALSIWLGHDIKISDDQLESVHQQLAEELLRA